MNKTTPRPFKKLLALLLIITLMFSLSSCSSDLFDQLSSAFSQQNNVYLSKLARGQEPVQQPGTQINDALSPISYEDRYGYASLDDTQKEIYNAINTAVLNYYHVVDLRKQPIPINDFMRLFYYYLDDHPEVFWVNPHVEHFFSGEPDELCIGVILQYQNTNGTEQYDSDQNEIQQKIPPEELTQMREEFNKEVNQILSLISPSDDEIQRELKIYDYIAQNVTYDHDLADTIISSSVTPSISQSAYGAVVERKTVCTGYAKLFSLLANTSGMACLSQYGTLEGVGHQWNIISLSGDYYHVDVTDPLVTNEGHTFIDYTYFNATDQDIQKTHTIKPSTLTESNYQVSYDTPACTAQTNTFTALFGITVSGGSFDRNDYQQKIKRLHTYNMSSLYFFFPAGTSSNAVQRFFNNNAAQMERLASGYFTLDEYYYYFETISKAYVQLYAL